MKPATFAFPNFLLLFPFLFVLILTTSATSLNFLADSTCSLTSSTDLSAMQSDYQAGIQIGLDELNSIEGGINGLYPLALITSESAATTGPIIARVGGVCQAGSWSSAYNASIPTIGRISLGGVARPTLNLQELDVRVPFEDEINSLVDYATRVRSKMDLSAFYDANTGVKGMQILNNVLSVIQVSLLSNGSYGSDGKVTGGFQTIISTPNGYPKAIFLIGTSMQPLVDFVVTAQKTITTIPPLFLVPSSLINPELFLQALKAANATTLTTVIFSQSVPPPSASSSNLIATFNRARASSTRTLGPTTSVMVEGYFVSQFLISVLRRLDPERTPSSDSFMTNVRTTGIFIFNETQFGPFSNTCSQGLRYVYLTSGDVDSTTGASKLVMAPQNQVFSLPMDGCYSDYNALQRYIVFGQSTVLSGSSANSGMQMRAGVLAAFEEQNRKGGIAGYKLHLVTLNDGYEPGPAVINTRALLDRNVFGLIGEFGSSTSEAVSPIISDLKVPFIGGLSGSDALRNPFKPYVINIRASYYDEATAIVDFLTRRMFITRFSIIYQNDSFGLSGLNGLNKALTAIKLKTLSVGTYTRNTMDVEQALSDIYTNALPLTPQAILMFGIVGPLVKFVGLAKQKFPPSTIYVTPSPAGMESFRVGLGSLAQNVLASQIVPLPNDQTSSYVRSYMTALSLSSEPSAPDWTSLEAYTGARVAVGALQRLPVAQIHDRQRFVDMIYSSSVFVLNDLIVGPFSTSCNQGLKRVWMSYVTPSGFQMPADYSFSFSPLCFSDVGVLRPPFIFGLVASLTGADQLLGRSYKAGVLAAIAEVNDVGGIDGHMLDVVIADDQSSPTIADSQAKDMILYGDVLAMFGTSNPVSAKSVMKWSVPNGVPFFGPASGNMNLRTYERSVILVRASDADEILALTTQFVQSSNTQIAALLIADAAEPADYAVKTIADVVAQAIGHHQVKPVAIATSIDGLFNKGIKPQAVLIWGNAAATVEAVASIRQRPDGQNVMIGIPSRVNPLAFQQMLSAKFVSPSGIIVSQVVPLPTGPSSNATIVGRFQTSNGSTVSQFNDVAAMEGYAVGRLAINVIKNIRVGSFSKSILLDSVYRSAMFTLNDLVLGPYLDTACLGSAKSASANCECNRGMHEVWLTSPTTSSTTPYTYLNPGAPMDETVFSFPGCGVVFNPYIEPQTGSGGINILIIILPLIAAIILGMVIGGWRMTKNYRQLRKLYSNEAVATKCAEAIAILQFDEVSYLKDLPNPNRIQQAFIHIINILSEVKKYVPDAVLQQLAASQDPGEEEDGNESPGPGGHSPVRASGKPRGAGRNGVLGSDRSSEASRDESCDALTSPHSSAAASQRGGRRGHRIPPPGGVGSHRPSMGTRSQISSGSLMQDSEKGGHSGAAKGLLPNRAWHKRRVTALFVAYDFGQFDEEKDAMADGSMDVKFRAILNLVVPIAKTGGGTIDSVTPSAVTVLWGAYANKAEGAQQACDTALEIANAVRTAPLDDVKMHMAISHGVCWVGEVSTDMLAVSLVVGEHMQRLPFIADHLLQTRLGTRILASAKAQDLAQFSHAFRTAAMVPYNGKSILLYQLVSKKVSTTGANEWMYKLMDDAETVSAYEVAFSLFLQGNLKQASQYLEEHMKNNSNDSLAMNLQKEIQMKEQAANAPAGALTTRSRMADSAPLQQPVSARRMTPPPPPPPPPPPADTASAGRTSIDSIGGMGDSTPAAGASSSSTDTSATRIDSKISGTGSTVVPFGASTPKGAKSPKSARD